MDSDWEASKGSGSGNPAKQPLGQQGRWKVGRVCAWQTVSRARMRLRGRAAAAFLTQSCVNPWRFGQAFGFRELGDPSLVDKRLLQLSNDVSEGPSL